MFAVVSGGSCSGKSAFAEDRVKALAEEIRQAGREPSLYYAATMQVRDDESRARVARHRAMRAGKGFSTVECPIDVCNAFADLPGEGSAVLLECLSNLVANEMFRGPQPVPEETVVRKVTEELRELRKKTEHLVIVTNNIFEDGTAYDEYTLAYIRALGRINAAIGREADEMTEVVCGIPVRIR